MSQPLNCRFLAGFHPDFTYIIIALNLLFLFITDPSDTLLLFNDVTTMVTEGHLLDTPTACMSASAGGSIG